MMEFASLHVYISLDEEPAMEEALTVLPDGSYLLSKTQSLYSLNI